MKRLALNHIISRSITAIVLVIACASCATESFTYEQAINDDGHYGGTAWDYISKAPTSDSLALIKDAIILAGMQNDYSTTEKRTFLVPKNKAFRAYMKAGGYASFSAMPLFKLQSLLKYHIAKGIYNTQDVQFLTNNKPIRYETEEGINPLFFSHNSSFQTLINEGTKKTYTVYTSNIQPTNGIINITTDVIVYIP